MKPLPILAAAAALATLAGAWALAPRGAALPPLAVSAQEAATAAPAGAPAEAPQIVEMTMGAQDAPVTVIEYASFTCPHCADFHEEVLPALKADYIDTGKVRLVYREVYFDRYGLWAAMLARCGDPMRYFGIADLLYDEQSEWARGEPAEVAGNLRRLGLKAGLEEGQIESCLSDAAMAQALVDRYEAQAAEDGIDSTPSFIIDGEKMPNMGEADFRKALDAALEG